MNRLYEVIVVWNRDDRRYIGTFADVDLGNVVATQLRQSRDLIRELPPAIEIRPLAA